MQHPDIVPISAGWYELDEDYSYIFTYSGLHLKITVPKGFKTDGASIPRWLWSILGVGRDGLHRAAAVVHDFLYKHQGRLPKGSLQIMRKDGAWEDSDYTPTRRDSDKLFLNIMKDAGVILWRRRLMYRAVRVAGKEAWEGRVT